MAVPNVKKGRLDVAADAGAECQVAEARPQNHAAGAAGRFHAVSGEGIMPGRDGACRTAARQTPATRVTARPILPALCGRTCPAPRSVPHMSATREPFSVFPPSRRDALKVAGLAGATLASMRAVHAQNPSTDLIRVGLIGAGGQIGRAHV